MATRVLGPTGSRRRRRFLFVSLFLVACSALFLIGSAQAVHNTKFFQLDGDAQANTKPTGVTSNGVEDWDTICAAHLGGATNTPGETCHKNPNVTLPTGGTLADRSTFITDAFQAGTDNIYKGGTDDGGILSSDGVSGSLWQWKEQGPSPNKADIEQAFAAQYTCTAAKQAANQCSAGSDFLNHKYIYFGGTRFANNGDTNIGLWFLHNKVTLGGANSSVVNGAIRCVNAQGTSLTSGCGFTGGHFAGNCSLPSHPTPCTPGDLFVQSAFTSKPTIKIYEWVGVDAQGHGKATAPCITNACTLQPVSFTTPQGQTDNKCETTGVALIDEGCAIVNDQGEITSPWLFQDSGPQSPANKIEASELFEGGLDLTALGFGDECISTVLLNTRSSGSSVNSTAQDFALGQFGGCSSELHTTAAGVASPGTIGGGSVSSGTDSATLTVNGISTWTGTLRFYLCGPIASGTCSDQGVLVSTKTVNQSTSQPVSSFIDAQNPGTATLTSAGRYCWYAKWTSGTTNVPDATDDGTPVPPATDNLECFNVAKVTPALTTHAVESLSLLSPVIFKGLADLNGDGNLNTGVDPTADNGQVFYGDTAIIGGKLDCNNWTTPDDGTAGDGVIDSSDDCTLTGVDGTADGVTIGVVDGSFATIDGAPIPDGTPLPTKFKDPAVTSSTVAAADFAWSAILGRVDANGDGSIGADDCSNNLVNTLDVLGSACGNSIPQGNGLVDVNDDGQITSADSCTGGCFLGHNVADGYVLAGAVDFGNAVTDIASLTGLAKEPGSNGGNATYTSINATNGAYAGTITFTLFGPSDTVCGSQTSGGTGTNPQSVAVDTSVGNKEYGPVSYTPASPGKYHWKATIDKAPNPPGSANNILPVNDNANCTQSREDVVVRQIPTDVKSKQSWYPNDTATITSTAAGDLLAAGGTVEFTLYATGTCTGTVLYKETKTNAIPAGLHSKELSTSNPGGGDTGTTSYQETSAYGDGANSSIGPRSWKVVYTPPDSAHLGSSSTCTTGHTESHSYTDQNDPGH